MSRITERDEFENNVKILPLHGNEHVPRFLFVKDSVTSTVQSHVLLGKGERVYQTYIFFPLLVLKKKKIKKIDKVDGSYHSGLTHSICLDLMFFMPLLLILLLCTKAVIS